MPARTTWSRLRFWSLVVAVTCGIIIAGLYLSATFYTGRFKSFPEFYLLLFALTVSSAATIGAVVRDQVLAGQRALLQAVEDLQLHILDYGDHRESRGHQVAMGVAKVQRGRLSPVE